MFRSKVKWIENGEKPTKYFYNLEKRSYEKKAITHDQLKAIEGEIVWDINDQTGNFYKAFLNSNSWSI